MKRAAIWILVVTLLLLAGCAGIFDFTGANARAQAEAEARSATVGLQTAQVAADLEKARLAYQSTGLQAERDYYAYLLTLTTVAQQPAPLPTPPTVWDDLKAVPLWLWLVGVLAVMFLLYLASVWRRAWNEQEEVM